MVSSANIYFFNLHADKIATSINSVKVINNIQHKKTIIKQYIEEFKQLYKTCLKNQHSISHYQILHQDLELTVEHGLLAQVFHQVQ